MGWVHATLLAAGLDGRPAFHGWVQSHATRWEAMADQCERTFGAVHDALDNGAVGLSLAGALSDVECAVALREAQTSSTLLHTVLGGGLSPGAEGDSIRSSDPLLVEDEAAEEETEKLAEILSDPLLVEDGAAEEEAEKLAEVLSDPLLVEDEAAEEEAEKLAEVLWAARKAIDQIVPGFLEDSNVFIRGHGFRDAEGQQQVRSSEAESYLTARRTLSGGAC